MRWGIESLSWLPVPPTDFPAQCVALKENPRDIGPPVRALACCALSDSQLARLAKVIAAARDRNPAGIEGLRPFTLGLLSNSMSSLLVPALVATGARYGFDLRVVEGAFDQVMQEALDPASRIKAVRPDAVLLALDYNGVPGLMDDLTADGEKAVESALDYVATLLGRMRQAMDATMVVQTVPVPPEPLFGNLDFRLEGTRWHRAVEFNAGLAQRILADGDILLDVAALAATVGLERWFDPVQRVLAKLPFHQAFVPLYADWCVRLLAASTGQTRKCLALDLDNTLWGGEIGEDGLEGIVLGQGSPEGEAFLAVQSMALTLRERGILLAVCSKNDDARAREPFRRHPDMLLREEHISVFQANWSDKATNLESIARTLGMGLDALVFLDDSPAERHLVRLALPQVWVPELPDDPSRYPQALLASGCFESVAFTADDRARADRYGANARRGALAQECRDLENYLRSLEMTAVLGPFDHVGSARVFQLIGRTNQFNLTTRRYTQAEVESMITDPTLFTLQVRLRDRFGDNGMISVVICGIDGDVWTIDTWLMSCRVINRRVEEVVLDEMVAGAKARGACALVGHYIPSGRNELVAGHYEAMGFSAGGKDGETEVWTLDLDGYSSRLPPITVVRCDEAPAA